MSYVAALHLYRIKLGTKLIRSLHPLWLGQGRSLYKGGGGLPGGGAAGAPAGVVSAFAEPSSWCAGAVLNVAGCAVCVLAAPSSWRIGGCAGCWRGSFDCVCCPHTSVLRPSPPRHAHPEVPTGKANCSEASRTPSLTVAWDTKRALPQGKDNPLAMSVVLRSAGARRERACAFVRRRAVLLGGVDAATPTDCQGPPPPRPLPVPPPLP